MSSVMERERNFILEGLRTQKNKKKSLKEVRGPVNELVEEIAKFCRDRGYELYSAYGYGDGTHSLRFSPNKEYYPEIYWDSMDDTFSVQTTSYGALKSEDHRQFLEGHQAACEIGEYLQSIDLEGLPVQGE